MRGFPLLPRDDASFSMVRQRASRILRQLRRGGRLAESGGRYNPQVKSGEKLAVIGSDTFKFSLDVFVTRTGKGFWLRQLS